MVCVCVNCVFISHSSTRGQWFNHALLESKIRGTMSFAQWWVLDLISKSLGIGWSLLWGTGKCKAGARVGATHGLPHVSQGQGPIK